MEVILTDECVPALTKKGNYTSKSWAMAWNCKQALPSKPFDGAIVRHLCENDSSAPNGFVCIKHIVWGTYSENNLDRPEDLSKAGKLGMESQFKTFKHNTQVQVTCPHCGKTSNKRIMARWHFDNCKFNTSLSAQPPPHDS